MAEVGVGSSARSRHCRLVLINARGGLPNRQILDLEPILRRGIARPAGNYQHVAGYIARVQVGQSGRAEVGQIDLGESQRGEIGVTEPSASLSIVSWLLNGSLRVPIHTDMSLSPTT